MSPEALQDRSQRLASLVGELGEALRMTGVSDDAASRVLESASAAVLSALTLDLLLSPNPVSAPAPSEQSEAALALPLAA